MGSGRHVLAQGMETMLYIFGGVISALGIFAGAVGAAAPDIWIDQDPELAALDETARNRARKVARIVGVCLSVLGLVGLCLALVGR
jgi:hypothetical protein